MNKVIYPDSNEALYNSVAGKFATIIDSGSGADKMIKSASSNSITRQMLDECKPDKDHFLIHCVGVGDYETYGFNKNADSFPKKANQKYYDTFEKHAKVYREHNTNDCVGSVKKAAYNPEMKRIELALWVNKKVASEQYEKALAGEPLSFSMGCSVKHDRDNISGKLCKTPKEYEPWMKMAAGKYIDSWDGKRIDKYAFVHNDEPKFFDISIVKNPAERIARYLEYVMDDPEKTAMVKAASSNDGPMIPSAIAAEIEGSFKSFKEFNHLNSSEEVNLLRKLASVENKLKFIFDKKSSYAKTLETEYIKHAAVFAFKNDFDLTDRQVEKLKQLRPETLFYGLAKRASILPFKSFIKLVGNDELVADDNFIKQASVIIPEVFTDLLNAHENNVLEIPNIIDAFYAGSKFEHDCDLANDDEAQKIMDDIEDGLSIDKDNIQSRISKVILVIDFDNKNNCETAPEQEICDKLKLASANKTSVSETVKKYAMVYGLYKLAALNDINRICGGLEDSQIVNSVVQNIC